MGTDGVSADERQEYEVVLLPLVLVDLPWCRVQFFSFKVFRFRIQGLGFRD